MPNDPDGRDQEEAVVKREFTHIAVEKSVQEKLKIMAPIKRRKMYDLVREWVDDAWEELVLAGLVAPLSPSTATSPHLEEHKMGGGGEDGR